LIKEKQEKAIQQPSHKPFKTYESGQCLTSAGSFTDWAGFVTAASEAPSVFSISPAILVATKRVESGLSIDPIVLNHNTNGTTDCGFFQVNTVVWLSELKRIGTQIQTDGLHGIRENALIAGWILRRQMSRSDVKGTLDAVGFYHKGGGTSANAQRIRDKYTVDFLKHLKVLIRRCETPSLTTAQR
jgi:hypothetical protein